MSDVAIRDLRNDTADVVRRVQAGEDVVLTVRGRPVARIIPVTGRSTPGMTAGEFLTRLPRAAADRGLIDDLAALGDDVTDTVGPW